MNRTLIGDFKIPPGSYGVFTLLTLKIWVALYDQLIVPLLTKITKIPCGITLQQRMGTRIFLSILATAVAAITEKIRRQHAIDEGLLNTPKGVVNMSAMWLIPQYAIIGLAEAFNAIGQIEFYYSQFPKRNGKVGHVNQANNMYLFPGIGLGSLLSDAHYISDGMLQAAVEWDSECSFSCWSYRSWSWSWNMVLEESKGESTSNT